MYRLKNELLITIKRIVFNSIFFTVIVRVFEYYMGTNFIPSWIDFLLYGFKLCLFFIFMQIAYLVFYLTFLKLGEKIYSLIFGIDHTDVYKKVDCHYYFLICAIVSIVYLGMFIYEFGPPGTFTHLNIVALKKYSAMEKLSKTKVNQAVGRLTPLRIAYSNNDPKAFDILLKKGARPNLTILNDKNETIIFYIIREGKVEFLKVLLKYSPDLKVKNINGKTPMDFIGKNKQISEIIWQATH